MSCSRTGTSICSRSGRSRTIALKSSAVTSSHIGTVRSSVSRLWRSTIIFCALADISTTSPLFSWYDGIVTRLPLTTT
jgi:hypothetical protein